MDRLASISLSNARIVFGEKAYRQIDICRNMIFVDSQYFSKIFDRLIPNLQLLKDKPKLME